MISIFFLQILLILRICSLIQNLQTFLSHGKKIIGRIYPSVLSSNLDASQFVAVCVWCSLARTHTKHSPEELFRAGPFTRDRKLLGPARTSHFPRLIQSWQPADFARTKPEISVQKHICHYYENYLCRMNLCRMNTDDHIEHVQVHFIINLITGGDYDPPFFEYKTLLSRFFAYKTL